MNHDINDPKNEFSAAHQYKEQKGLRKFGECREQALVKEMSQQYERECFVPRHRKSLSVEELKKAKESITFLTDKRDGEVKGRTVYNGKSTREWLSCEETASPTAATESIFLSKVIDAKEGRDIMPSTVPNAFIQTPMDYKHGEPRVIMKLRGLTVDILLNKYPDIYKDYVIEVNGKKVLYVEVTKAISGQLQASLLWYKKFRRDLKGHDFVFNKYDPCVANKLIHGKQMTIRFHVDDVLSSHVDPKANDRFLKWLNDQYSTYGPVKATRGSVHEYLGMTFEFGNSKVVKSMLDYVKELLEDFDENFCKLTSSTPATNEMFSVGAGSALTEKHKEIFHKTMAKALLVCKRARPDIQPIVAVLCMRVKLPNENDWNKLVQMLKYLNGTNSDKLTISAGSEKAIERLDWFVDTAFAIHLDMKGHTGMAMKFRGGTGAPLTTSVKQKLNTSSSTTCKLVAVDQVLPLVLWTPLFLKEQGVEVKENVLHQDNKSAILLEENGNRSTGKRTHTLDIRYFMVTDQVEHGNVSITYCPMDDMVGDFILKGLTGAKFKKLQNEIMGI